MEFEGSVERFSSGSNSYYLKIPGEIAGQLLNSNTKRRVVAIFNQMAPHHCALMHDGKGGWVIHFHKKAVKKYNLRPGQKLNVQIKGDDSNYGMPMPREFEELLKQDPEGSGKFHTLTKGMQRSFIYFVAQVKSPDIRLRRALVVLEHLKTHEKPDGDLLMEEMKEANRRWNENPF